MRAPGTLDPLLPLVVVVPLLVAALLAALSALISQHRRVLDLVAIATSVAVSAMLVVLMARTAGGVAVYWFAGLQPRHGAAIGIDFAAGSLSCGLAALTAVLVTASMVFSWRYFETASTWFHSLMLVFLAGMVGFCLTGDIFDLFVWFEVMGVAAYALTAFRVEEKGPLQGAYNFAITNSVGAYLSLLGIGLIYARTGALNMAQIGRALGHGRPGSLVVVAFVLVLVGLITKGAIVPFHFWLADAHAVAPTPVCVLFSGVMVELGLYGVARVYWSVFGAGLGHRSAITAAFLALGILTALVGAFFSYRQRHLKRMLAFSTISHAGLFLVGFALLTPLGLAGAAAYVIGHGLVKAALFLCVGAVLHRLGSVDESRLHGRGRALKTTGVVFTLAALGLADLPPFATYLGAGWVGDSASSHGAPYVTAVVMISSILVGGAVLRVAGGVFYGLGDPPREDPRLRQGATEERSETSGDETKVPLTMTLPPLVLVAAAAAIGLLPHLGSVLQHAALQVEDEAGYVKTVLGGAAVHHLSALSPKEPTAVRAIDLESGFGTAAGALLLALGGLYYRRLPGLKRLRPARVVADTFDRLQSGVVNDYLTWLVFGVACIGGALAFSLR